MRGLFLRIRGVTLGGLVLALAGSGQRAEAGIPVIDYTHIMTAIGNTAKEIKEWTDYLNQFRQYYALTMGIYQGVHSWQGMEWLEALSIVELPFFDGIDGIDDLRDVAAGSMMTVQDLQDLYTEIELIQRLETDKRYRNMVAYQGRMTLMRSHWQRVARIRMMVTRALQKHQQDMQTYRSQQKYIQARLEIANAQSPAPQATISTLQAKLQEIQVKIDASSAALQDKLGAIRTKETHDNDVLNAKMQVAWSKSLEEDGRKALFDEYWKRIFKEAGIK